MYTIFQFFLCAFSYSLVFVWILHIFAIFPNNLTMAFEFCLYIENSLGSPMLIFSFQLYLERLKNVCQATFTKQPYYDLWILSLYRKLNDLFYLPC